MCDAGLHPPSPLTPISTWPEQSRGAINSCHYYQEGGVPRLPWQPPLLVLIFCFHNSTITELLLMYTGPMLTTGVGATLNKLFIHPVLGEFLFYTH
jgi:hypothetical protein